MYAFVTPICISSELFLARINENLSLICTVKLYYLKVCWQWKFSGWVYFSFLLFLMCNSATGWSRSLLQWLLGFCRVKNLKSLTSETYRPGVMQAGRSLSKLLQSSTFCSWVNQASCSHCSILAEDAAPWLIQSLVKLDKVQEDYPGTLGLVLSYHNNNIIYPDQILTSSFGLPDD